MVFNSTYYPTPEPENMRDLFEGLKQLLGESFGLLKYKMTYFLVIPFYIIGRVEAVIINKYSSEPSPTWTEPGIAVCLGALSFLIAFGLYQIGVIFCDWIKSNLRESERIYQEEQRELKAKK